MAETHSIGPNSNTPVPPGRSNLSKKHKRTIPKPQEDIKPLDKNAYPNVHAFLTKMVSKHEVNRAEESLKEKYKENSNEFILKILNEVFENKITPSLAAERIKKLSEFGLTKIDIEFELRDLFRDTKDYEKKVLVLNVIENVMNPWEILFRELSQANRNDDSIKYLSSKSDEELSEYIQKALYKDYYFYGNNRRNIASNLLKIRNGSFIFREFYKSFCEHIEEEGAEEILKILIGVIKQCPKLLTFNSYKTLCKKIVDNDFYDNVASLFIRDYPEKAHLFFLEEANRFKKNTELDIRHSLDGIYNYAHAISKKEGEDKETGIKNIIKFISTCKHPEILAYAMAGFTEENFFKGEGQKRLVDYIYYEIQSSAQEKDFIPISLATLTLISQSFPKYAKTLKKVFSKTYENDELIKAYKKLNGVELFSVSREDKKVRWYIFKSKQYSIPNLIAKIGFINIYNWSSSKNEILRKNMLDVFECALENSKKKRLFFYETEAVLELSDYNENSKEYRVGKIIHGLLDIKG